eukprot:3080376-Pyramimonas_sp.AAC.1
MTAGGHAKGRIDRASLLQVMEDNQFFKYEVKKYMPHRGKKDSANIGVQGCPIQVQQILRTTTQTQTSRHPLPDLGMSTYRVVILARPRA